MNDDCKQKCDQDVKSIDDDKIDLENQLDQLTEKLKNAMETGVEMKESLGNNIWFYFVITCKNANQESVQNVMKRLMKSQSWLEIKLTMKTVFSVNIAPQSIEMKIFLTFSVAIAT